MSSGHISTDAVRSYLLGVLPEAQADALENAYFSDDDCFERMKSIERELIGDYLQGRLSPEQAELFQKRYTTVPELRRALDEARGQREAKSTKRVPLFRKPVFALAAATLLVCFAIWIYPRPSANPASSPERSINQGVVSLTPLLTPGLLKSAESAPHLITIPRDGSVGIRVELPGVTAPVGCFAKLSLAGEEGLREVWITAQPVSSKPSGGGQDLVLVLDAARLKPGDYVLEVTGSPNNVRETYVFRAVAAQ